MKIFVAGCIHGMWDELVGAVNDEISRGNNIDLVLVNGDCFAFRNREDCKSCNIYPEVEEEEERGEYTFDSLYGTFHKIYEGTTVLPCLFVLIGGNNEGEDLFAQLPYGGFIAPNVYYAGRTSIIDYKSIRIAAYSGCDKPSVYFRSINEKVPIRSYPVMKFSHGYRAFQSLQLKLYSKIEAAKPVDIVMSHNWPQYAIHELFDQNLLSKCPYMEDISKEDLNTPTFGVPYGYQLLKLLKPKFWTAAHHHIRFLGDLNVDGNTTKFVALPRPNEEPEWYQVIEVEAEKTDDDNLYVVPEWIAVLRETQDLMKDPKMLKNRGKNDFWEELCEERKDRIQATLTEVSRQPKEFFALNKAELDPNRNTDEFCRKYHVSDPYVPYVPRHNRGGYRGNGNRGGYRGNRY